MKRFSAADRHKPVDRKRATHCLIVNQLATPGLGSLLGRRFIAGTGQLILAVVGFCLVILYFMFLFRSSYQELVGGAPVSTHNEYGKYGALIFLASWIWSWFTSLSLLRAAKHNDTPSNVPPKL
jgi:hypothetical protein